MPPSTLTAGGTSAASAIELDDDEGNAADESRYRIKKKKPAAVQPKIEGATHHGFIIAYTTAKIHGLQGVCLAVYDERTCAIRRLCSQHSESSPFWDRALVADLRLGAAIEYKISPEPPQTEFPHKTEDVYAVELQRRPAPALLHRDCIRLLEPLAATALSATWPDHLRADEKRPCVLSGARVPSLAVFRGCVTAFDKESGLACLRIQCGTELTRIKVNCNREQALLRSGHGANEESLLLLGLARARPPSTTCLILLVSRTPLQALRPALAPAVEQPRAQSSVHVAAANVRRRVRAFAIGTKVVIGRGDADRVVSQPELNGKSGVVISFDEAKGRYVVRVRMDTSLSKKDISLKPDVLDGLTSDGVSYVWAGGAVKSFSRKRGHCVVYDDGETKWHTFDDDDEIWKVLA